MRCGFCGKEIPAQVGRAESCGGCGGGCRKVHCPHCGYANPAVTGLLKRWLDRRPDHDNEDQT